MSRYKARVLSLIAGTTLLLLVSSLPSMAVATGGSLGSPATAYGPTTATVGTATLGSTQVSLATRSLQQGAGPAAGGPVSCDVGPDGTSASCQSVSASTASSPATSAKASPSSRWGSNMAYDARDGYVVLFSGSGAKNDTWTFSNGTWTELNLSVAPSQRTYAGMTYDTEDHYVLLFGGHHGSNTYLNDTWMFKGGKWTQIAAVNAPPPRAYADMTYDAASTDHYVLLFGGNTSQAFFGDTWTYAGGVWTNITPSTLTPTNSPSARAFSSMAYDTKNGYVVLYGGGSHGEALRDTWKFVDGRWSQLKPAVSPQASYYTMMAFNGPSGSTGRYVLLFGGIANGRAYPYTWEFLLGKWTNITPTLSPPARFGASMVYDAQDGYMVLFGGISQPRPGAPVLGDTWTFANGTWTNRTPLPVHTVTFSESHLPKGSVWSVLVDGMTVSSDQSTLRFELSNGAYNYTVDPVTGYTTNSTGMITVAGANLKVAITFEKDKSSSLPDLPRVSS